VVGLQIGLLLPRIGIMREIKQNRQWDVKKLVLVGLLLVGILVLIIFFKFYFFAASDLTPQVVKTGSKAVEGISTENIQKVVQEKLDSVKEQADKINVTDIATSSPQVQKLIKDIKALEGYPSSQARIMCENLCKSL
jgi:hypothetical protein